MKKIIIITLLALSGLYSCSVLDKKPLDIISDSDLWNDPVFIDKYLLECYAEMGFYNEMQLGGNHDDVASNTPMVALGISDEAHSAWVQTPKTHWINVTGGVYEWWGYYVVRRLNIFLERLPNSPLNAETCSRKMAEARFLRAFCYFQMVKRYGGVPLITRSMQLTDSNEVLYAARDTEEAVYDFILEELDDLIDNELLPGEYGAGDLGRPTIWAAAALKSRAAMYAASIATWGEKFPQYENVVGIPSEKARHYWTESRDASDFILTQGPFSLYKKYFDEDKTKNYRNIFLDENNCEVIFSERFDGKSGKGHSWDHWQNPAAYNSWNEGQGHVVYLEFVESYENVDGSDPKIDREKVANYHQWTMEELFGKKDPRFAASIYTHGTPWTHNGERVYLDYHQGVYVGNGEWIEEGVVPEGKPGAGLPAQGIQQTKWRPSAFGVLKYLDEEAAMVPERLYSDTDWIVFRLGEIYLNKAEAEMELGNEPAARAAVNEIRLRAGMPTFESAITRDQIRQERKIELAFEGNRYWDLRRWRIAETALTNAWHGLRYKMDGETGKLYVEIIPDIAGTPVPYFNKMHYYLPIAQWRVSQNPKFIQNPYYN